MREKNLKGRTEFNTVRFLGYVLWKQSDGFHFRWTTKGSKSNNFQGKIIYEDKFMITKRAKRNTEIDISEENSVGWDTTLRGKVDGFNFRTPGNFTVILNIKNKKIKPKKIYLGPNLTQPDSNPFTIVQRIDEIEEDPNKKSTPKTESEVNGEKEEIIA